MAEKGEKESFLIYTSYLEKFEDLTDEQFGQLTRAMMKYCSDGNIPEIKDNLVKIAFKVAKYDMDNNLQKYKEACEKKREAIRRRWGDKDKEEKKNIDMNRDVYISTKSDRHYTDNDNDNEKGHDNVNDNVNVNDNEHEGVIIKREYSGKTPNSNPTKNPSSAMIDKIPSNLFLTEAQVAKLAEDYPALYWGKILYYAEWKEKHGFMGNDYAKINDWLYRDTLEAAERAKIKAQEKEEKQKPTKKDEDLPPDAFPGVETLSFGEEGT